MTRYAEQTTVPVERSRAEIERILERYGADQFMYGWDRTGAMIAFRAHGRHVRFMLPLPDPKDRAFTHYRRGQHGAWQERTVDAAQKAWEQACRQRWRALALAVKAKLEAVATGITTFEQEFLAHIMLPDGSTFGEWAAPELDRVYADGEMPRSLQLALPAPDVLRSGG